LHKCGYISKTYKPAEVCSDKNADEISMGCILGMACRTHGGEEECIQDIYGKAKGRDHEEDLAVGEKIILKWILWSWDSSRSGQEPVEGFCEHGNEPSSPIKFWGILM
jgi:hypothetical protein